MLKIMAQAISSDVAPMVPCIWGKKVDAIGRVVEQRVDPRMTAAMIEARRTGVRERASALSDMAGLPGS